jgi:hypothetical protein
VILISSRKGFQEDRDSHRLKDRSSRPVTCYACAGSSIPLRSLTTDPGSSWRPIVSCDYCSLSWHLDCLNPPLAVTPNSGKKWMCPNHAEQVMVSGGSLAPVLWVKQGMDTDWVEEKTHDPREVGDSGCFFGRRSE